MRKQEETLQIAVSTFLKVQYPHVVFTSESSGVRVGIGAAKKMKAQRSNCKLPDLIILEPKGEFHGLILELKTEGKSPYLKNGELSKQEHVQEQNRTLEKLRNKGYYACFAVGFDAAHEKIEWYMGL